MNVLVSSVKATTVKDNATGLQSIELDESWSYVQSLPIDWEPGMSGMPEWKIIELIRKDCIKNNKPFDKRFITWQQSVERKNQIRSYRISKHAPTIDRAASHYDHYR